ncbi:hypothetical protein [Entomomonas asaccharolytica]|uniref:1-deoxy-D-xylulose-5-phosphate synthase n=1 Tax=Entomomonas asaccharolytica TaxID=2785331 RepID=A0A974RWT1_9GAMM|nr:hypothetical protein [Entomomonas asaccharolytica]QQP85518.1 hypothetical protein JHT90_14265 [Entomomonas asaccharolytica]
MKSNQLTLGQTKRVMYIENKEGLINDANACTGWVSFSKTGKTIYYKGKAFVSNKGKGVNENYNDLETGEEYWISGIKKRGSNVHPCESIGSVVVDEDARDEYNLLRAYSDN